MENTKIKFRAWDGEQMLYPDNAHQHAGSGVMVLLMDMEGKTSWNNPYGFYPEQKAHVELMQCIEVKDKNGTDIFEGDIINTPNGNDWGVIVRKGHCFEVTVSKDQSSLYTKEFLQSSAIIGNIYQNPELLNK